MAGNDQAIGRTNQRHRTRKDLLAAAGRLLKAGRTPDMDEVAREAMVSRATAYRYFPSIEALLVEAPLDGAVPGPEAVFAAGDQSTDVAERAVRAERAMHEAVYRNEAQLRVMLAASLERGGNGGSEVPVRQNRRTALIEAALAPARERLGEEAYGRLCAALALVFGTEAMVVFKDVLGVDEERAREVKGWAVRALVRAAEGEGTSPAQ
jgi:AcrR family transcriptional regulator